MSDLHGTPFEQVVYEQTTKALALLRAAEQASAEILGISDENLGLMLEGPRSEIAKLEASLAPLRARAIALFVREVACELLYRNRARWDAEHPNRALGMREPCMHPDRLAAAADTAILWLGKQELREEAAAYLDQCDAQRDAELTSSRGG
jgi:hypothetical protein